MKRNKPPELSTEQSLANFLRAEQSLADYLRAIGPYSPSLPDQQQGWSPEQTRAARGPK